VSGAGLVRVSFADERQCPVIIEPRLSELRLPEWAAAHQASLSEYLNRHGAVLFRGFKLRDPGEFEEAIRATSGANELLEYAYRSSPRTQISDRIYTSTDYPPAHSIFLHNENSYQQTWPMKLYFHCVLVASEGGETPIADSRRIYARISPSVRERFAEKGWLYVRNFGAGLGLPWQSVFQTTEKSVVEEHCRRNGIDFEWKQNDCLRTRAIRPAIHKHPRTGETVWFNHATFFHVTTLEPSVRELLRAEFAEDELPANSFYGDGSPLENEVLEDLREIYRSEEIVFPWQKDDVLMLDNMLMAHGRRPYAGERKILVGMAEPYGEAE
jgi:alpha-ketoglutarate-dependent taurine dioxygenase